MIRHAVLALALLAGACAKPFSPPVVLEPVRFDGVAQAAQAAPDPKGVDILVVHGMCTHTQSMAAEFNQALARNLDAQFRAPLETARVPAPTLPGIDVVPYDFDSRVGLLRVRYLRWSPMVQGHKTQLCYDRSATSESCPSVGPHPQPRASLNAAAKDFLDECLADALIYQGRAGPEIRAGMKEAIAREAAHNDGRVPLIVIAESLGSKIVFDSLREMSRASAAGGALLGRVATIFMWANQVPLLALADQTLQEAAQPGLRDDSLKALIEEHRRTSVHRATGKALTVVAFSDPNDLLTYTLEPRKYPGAMVGNVIVSNAYTWLGSVEDPIAAHTGYRSNPDVLRLVACGWPTSGRCP